MRLNLLSQVTFLQTIFVSVIFATLNASADNWSSFRGSNGQGVSEEQGLPLHWTNTDHITWKTELSGEGWSSPIVHEGVVYLTTTTEEGKSCRLISYNAKTGKETWNIEVHR